MLVRAYGAARCTWRGLDHFKAYIWSAVVAINDCARHQSANSGRSLRHPFRLALLYR